MMNVSYCSAVAHIACNKLYKGCNHIGLTRTSLELVVTLHMLSKVPAQQVVLSTLVLLGM